MAVIGRIVQLPKVSRSTNEPGLKHAADVSLPIFSNESLQHIFPYNETNRFWFLSRVDHRYAVHRIALF